MNPLVQLVRAGDDSDRTLLVVESFMADVV